MDFLVGDATGLLRRVDAATRCTYTYKVLPQDRSEAVCCACWSGGQGLSATAASETELTLGRRSGRVEAIAPALPPRVRTAVAAASPNAPSSSAVPHLLIRNSYTAATPVVRGFQMPAACVQVGLLHEPQDRLLLNASLRDDLIYHDPFFAAFNSVCPLSPSPLLPSPTNPSLAARARDAAGAAEAADTAAPYGDPTTDAANAGGADAAEPVAATVEAREAASLLEDPRLLFCIDEVGHLVLLDWHDRFFEKLRSDQVSSNSSTNDGRCTRICMRSVPPYKVKGARVTLTNKSSNGGDICSSGRYDNVDGSGAVSNHTSRDNGSTTWSNETATQSTPETAGTPTGEPWYCWSTSTSEEEDEVACHVRAAWRVCGPVSCATPVNPLLPDRVAFGGRNNDAKVFDFSQEKYVWAAKNVKNTLLLLQVPVHISSLCWLPQIHPLVLAAGTAAGALRLYDLRCQRRPVFEQEYACSSSSLGGAAARERRVLSALCTETCNEEAAALLASIRKSRDVCSSSNSKGNTSSRQKNSDDERSSSTCWVSKRSLISRSSGSTEAGRHINGNVVQNHNGTIHNKGEGRQTRMLEAREATTVTEAEEETFKIYEAVRSLYGREKTRVFFADNHGAVYVHRVLTGQSLLRRIDPKQKKHNRTSWHASSSSSSSEAESEDETENDDSHEDEETAGEEGEGDGDATSEETSEGEREGHREAEKKERTVQTARKQDKGQRQHESTNHVLLHRGIKKKRNSGRRKPNEDETEANLSTTDGVRVDNATTSETPAETESEGAGPQIAAPAGEAEATGGRGLEYDKRYAIKLLQHHRSKRLQRLSAIKNSGRLSQSSDYGAQYLTLFEGCYKGAMGAIVALVVDKSMRLLVGAGYGRHTLVWNVRSRKLLFKVYLKQQLRTVVLRCSEERSHDLTAPKLLQSPGVQQETQQQSRKHGREEIPSVQQHKTQQHREPSELGVKEKQKRQRQQLSEQLNVPQRSQKTMAYGRDYSDTSESTDEPRHTETRILQAPVKRCPTGVQQRQQRPNRSKRREKQKVVEKAQNAEQQRRTAQTLTARKRSTGVEGRQLTRMPSDTKRRQKLCKLLRFARFYHSSDQQKRLITCREITDT